MNMGRGLAHPTIDRCYPDPNDPKQAQKEAYKRHMAFYNCTPDAFVLGLAAASMEEAYAEDPDSVNPDPHIRTPMGPSVWYWRLVLPGTICVIALTWRCSCQVQSWDQFWQCLSPLSFCSGYLLAAWLSRWPAVPACCRMASPWLTDARLGNCCLMAAGSMVAFLLD